MSDLLLVYPLLRQLVLLGSILSTTRCYETKKRAHETLFGGEACSSAHCTLLLSAT